MPELLEDATVEAIRIRAKRENDDYICRGHILNGMSDSLFDVYTKFESAKELWDSLEYKYMAEDASSKKFPFNELLRILGQYTQHGLKMDESISVSSVIDKLHPSWKDFKHTLKHDKDDLSFVQLGSHLCIEESLRAQESDKGNGKEVGGPFVNMTEEGGKNKHHKQKKTSHFKRDCRSGKKNNANAGGSEKGSKDQSQHQDSGATTHVCKDRCWFNTYEPVEEGFVLYMGDDHFAPVHGKGSALIHETYSSLHTTQNGGSERKNRALKEMFYSKITNSGYPSVLAGYRMQSWINHVEDSSSTSGWGFLLGEGAISWASNKQTNVYLLKARDWNTSINFPRCKDLKGTTICEHECLPLQEAWT
ncbi:hypothetical protein Tco_1179644 [Tanacetum coccineum]